MLIGRDEDLELVLDFALGRTRPRIPALLLTGDAGIGKTALIDEVAPAAEAAGLRVYRSSAVEDEADLVFGGLNQLLAPLLDALPALSPTHRGALETVFGLSPGPEPSVVVVGAAALALIATDAARPTLFVVDDAALLDRASAMALAYVARRVPRDESGGPVRFLLTARSGVENAFVRSGFDVHALRALSDADADALLATRFPQLTPDARRRARVAADGNPLALLDLPTELDSATAPLRDVRPLAERLRAAYARRLADLPPPTRQLLLVVALAGVEVDQSSRRVRDLTGPGADLTPAERLGLVRVEERTGRIGFRHPLIRAAVVESATTAQRRAAHAILAVAFADDPRRRAWHLGESAVWPAPGVATELDEVADELVASGDARRAIATGLRAAELTQDQADRGRRIARAAYLSAAFTGELQASEALIQQARHDPDAPLPLGLVAACALAQMSRDGDTPGAHRLLDAALDAVPGGLTAADSSTVEALHLLVYASILAGRADLWAQTRRQLGRVSPALPETLAVLRGGYPDAVRPDDAALDRLDAAVRSLAFVSDPLRITRTITPGVHLDRVPLARDALERVVEDGRSGGAVARQIQSLIFLAMADFSAGTWDALDTRTDEALELSDRLGYTLLSMGVLYTRALADAVRGHDVAAEQAVERLLQWAAPRGLQTFAAYASHVQCLRAIGREQFDEAFRHAASVEVPGAIAAIHTAAFWTVFDLVEAASRSGHDAEARTHVDLAIDAGVDRLSPRLQLTVGGAAALISRIAWVEDFEQALTTHGAGAFPFDEARVRLAYGERLRRDRRLADARAQLLLASATFTRLGAAPWLRRATRELRAAGGSPPGASRTRDLTSQEAEIARLAASGLTNKEIAGRLFLSPRTVSTHLSHAFAKLGVGSRHDLAQALRALTPV